MMCTRRRFRRVEITTTGGVSEKTAETQKTKPLSHETDDKSFIFAYNMYYRTTAAVRWTRVTDTDTERQREREKRRTVSVKSGGDVTTTHRRVGSRTRTEDRARSVEGGCTAAAAAAADWFWHARWWIGVRNRVVRPVRTYTKRARTRATKHYHQVCAR